MNLLKQVAKQVARQQIKKHVVGGAKSSVSKSAMNGFAILGGLFCLVVIVVCICNGGLPKVLFISGLITLTLTVRSFAKSYKKKKGVYSQVAIKTTDRRYKLNYRIDGYKTVKTGSIAMSPFEVSINKATYTRRAKFWGLATIILIILMNVANHFSR